MHVSDAGAVYTVNHLQLQCEVAQHTGLLAEELSRHHEPAAITVAHLSRHHRADPPQDASGQPANEVASCRQHSQAAGAPHGLLEVILGPTEGGMHEASEETHHIPAPGPTM